VSIETTVARAVAREAEQAWRHHLGYCSRCAVAVRKRDMLPLGGCPDGRELYGERADANLELRRQRALDRQPAPDQLSLFEVTP
jgi:hypothetical protein